MALNVFSRSINLASYKYDPPDRKSRSVAIYGIVAAVCIKCPDCMTRCVFGYRDEPGTRDK
jgi:hypothetical protein